MTHNKQKALDIFRRSQTPRQEKKHIVDWTKLQRGDTIKSVRGHGPYYLGAGGKLFKGEYGTFVVDEIVGDGIHAYETARSKHLIHGGRRFIYMGAPKKVDIIHREPHKLVKV